MKPKNFPARKLKRKIDAEIRKGKGWEYEHREYLIAEARKIKTKKNRI